MSRPKLLHPWPMPSKLISYHCHYSPSNKWLSSKAQRLYISTRDFTPRILQPSLWQSVIPKAIRERISKPKRGKQQKGYNPATFFIVIFLVIGSNAIQMIGLRNDARSFSRRSDAKIGLLKEVIERVQRGEKVDVEGLLGTGDERKEQEWEKVIHDIEDADENWDPTGKKRKDRQAARMQDGQPSTSHQDEPIRDVGSAETNMRIANLNINNSESTLRGFY